MAGRGREAMLASPSQGVWLTLPNFNITLTLLPSWAHPHHTRASHPLPTVPSPPYHTALDSKGFWYSILTSFRQIKK